MSAAGHAGAQITTPLSFVCRFVDDSQSNGRFVYQSRIAIVKPKAFHLFSQATP
jgi:hypothetical protein